MSDAGYTPSDANMTDDQGNAVYAPPPAAGRSPDGLSDAERARIAAEDKPLEDDPIGNAIPGMLVGGVESVFEGAAHLATTAIGEGIAYVGEHVFGDSHDDAGGDASGAGGAPSGDGTDGGSAGYDSSVDGGASDGEASGGSDDSE
jgi:hypothetical protein